VIVRISAALLFLACAAQAQQKSGPPPKGRTESQGQPSAEPPSSGDRRAQPDATAEEAGEENDEDLAARALERSLIQRGALILPVWGIEIEPELSYVHTGSSTLLTLPEGSVNVRSRTHDLAGLLSFRLGLPWEAQFDASLPFRRVARDLVLGGTGDAALGAGLARDYSSAAGIGDPRFRLSYLIRARRALPDLLISGSWRAPVGKSPYNSAPGGLGLGSGFHSIGPALTVSKALDPIVYLAHFSYTANLTADTSLGRLEPGDSYGVSAGAILAASPEASMSLLMDFEYTSESLLAGRAALGTDRTIGVLQLGLALVTSRRTLLSFAAGIGVTADAPDLQLRFGVPLRL
jgi:hypothetical protein